MNADLIDMHEAAKLLRIQLIDLGQLVWEGHLHVTGILFSREEVVRLDQVFGTIKTEVKR